MPTIVSGVSPVAANCGRHLVADRPPVLGGHVAIDEQRVASAQGLDRALRSGRASATRSTVAGSTAVRNEVRAVHPEPVLAERRDGLDLGRAQRPASPASGLNGVNELVDSVKSAFSVSVSAASNDAFSEAREDRHHRDEPEADHQRGRGRRGPTGVPHRVLASQPTRDRQAAERSADRADDRARDQRRQHRDPDEGERGAQPDRLDARSTRRAEQADSSAPTPSDRDGEPDDEPAPASSRLEAPSPASRSASTGATEPARRAGRIDAATVTHRRRRTSDTMIVRGWSCSAVLGSSMPNAPSSPWSPTAMPMPATMPTTDATSPTIARLDDHRRRSPAAGSPRARGTAPARGCAARR